MYAFERDEYVNDIFCIFADRFPDVDEVYCAENDITRDIQRDILEVVLRVHDEGLGDGY